MTKNENKNNFNVCPTHCNIFRIHSNLALNPPTNTHRQREMCGVKQYIHLLKMWANAQRDCRPVEYRWRPLFNAAKSG